MVTRRVESRVGALDGREMLDEREREERRIYNVLYSIVYRLEEDEKDSKKRSKSQILKRREIISSNVFVVLPMRMPIKKTVNIASGGGSPVG